MWCGGRGRGGGASVRGNKLRPAGTALGDQGAGGVVVLDTVGVSHGEVAEEADVLDEHVETLELGHARPNVRLGEFERAREAPELLYAYC